MAKNTTLGHLTTWPKILISAVGHLPKNCRNMTTWPNAVITLVGHLTPDGQALKFGHLTHLAKYSDQHIWPSAYQRGRMQ